MSMHEIEDYIEEAVRAAARSGMPISEKRSLIHSLFQVQQYGDCGFTNLRTLKEMVDCRYTFVFDKTEMYDYETNRTVYDTLAEQGGFSQGKPYTPQTYDEETGVWTKHPDKVCIDSGSTAWQGMVDSGAITGEGAEPVARLADLEVLRKAKELLEPLDEDLMQAHVLLFVLSGAIDSLPEEAYPEHFGMTQEAFEDMLEGA